MIKVLTSYSSMCREIMRTTPFSFELESRSSESGDDPCWYHLGSSKSCCCVPFKRNKLFVGRAWQLNKPQANVLQKVNINSLRLSVSEASAKFTSGMFYQQDCASLPNSRKSQAVAADNWWRYNTICRPRKYVMRLSCLVNRLLTKA